MLKKLLMRIFNTCDHDYGISIDKIKDCKDGENAIFKCQKCSKKFKWRKDTFNDLKEIKGE